MTAQNTAAASSEAAALPSFQPFAWIRDTPNHGETISADAVARIAERMHSLASGLRSLTALLEVDDLGRHSVEGELLGPLARGDFERLSVAVATILADDTEALVKLVNERQEGRQ